DQRDAHIAEQVLVPLEHALEGGITGGVGVSVDAGADVLFGHPAPGVRERDDEVEQAFGRLHTLSHSPTLAARTVRRGQARRGRSGRRASAVATAASAASAPLSSREPGRPARSRACSSVSTVRTPKPTGTPVSTLTWVRPVVAAWQT